jgi:unsaturated rhamnogalacturonyl hydrolase
MKRFPITIVLGLLLGVAIFQSCKQQAEQKKSSSISTDLPWSQRMAETIMHDFPELWRTEEATAIKWTYTKGLACDAFIALWKDTGDKRYFDYAKAWADTMINANGVIWGYKEED